MWWSAVGGRQNQEREPVGFGFGLIAGIWLGSLFLRNRPREDENVCILIEKKHRCDSFPFCSVMDRFVCDNKFLSRGPRWWEDTGGQVSYIPSGCLRDGWAWRGNRQRQKRRSGPPVPSQTCVHQKHHPVVRMITQTESRPISAWFR